MPEGDLSLLENSFFLGTVNFKYNFESHYIARKWKIKYHSVRTVKIYKHQHSRDTGKIVSPTRIYTTALSLLCTSTSIKGGGCKLVYEHLIIR
jgi:hypothetical protein